MHSLEEQYDICLAEGYITPLEEINEQKAKNLRLLAEEDMRVAELAMKTGQCWSTVFRTCYSAIRSLADSLISFDKVSAANDDSLFVYLCYNHPELELSWDFFEKMRVRNDGVNNGSLATQRDWKEIEVQLRLYAEILKKEIDKSLRT